jgi:hypothetical protein
MAEVVFMAVNGESSCHICGLEHPHGVCSACKKAFCYSHRSSLDDAFCAQCVDFVNTRIETKPLIDDEGVQHKGRQLILTGETWMRNRDIIAKMTDVELEAKLTALKEAVHEAEMILDFRKIARTQVESEIGDRYSRKLGRRRLISAMDSVHKSNTKIPGSPNEKVEIAKDALKALKNMGLNKDAIANILIKMTQKAKP